MTFTLVQLAAKILEMSVTAMVALLVVQIEIVSICVVSSKEAKAGGAPFAAIFAAHFANYNRGG